MTKEPALREMILDILMEVLEKNQYSHLVLSRALAKYQYLEKADRSFIKRIVDGTVEYRLQIDFILNSYSRVKVMKMKPIIRTILRMSVYQILYMDRVPDSAACNEAVKLAEKRGFSGLKGFVNGVLRNISRNKEKLTFPDDSIRYSCPQWILDLWKQSYPEETVRRMLAAFLEKQELMARCNLNRASMEEILASLKRQGVEAVPAAEGSTVLSLQGVDYLEGLEAFRQGWLQIQDISSSLVGDAVGIREGEQVLDVCGAPGGKSLHSADLLRGTGLVTVRDLSEAKVALIEENIERSGFTNIRAEVWDALEFDPEFEKKADVVFADLPCSGLGIIGRKPDIKYNASPEKLLELSRLQREILSVVWRYVKPGGRICFSTCTINPGENEENRDWFLDHFPFEPVDLTGRLGKEFETGSEKTVQEGYLQLLPGIHPCDGFFLSVMQRKMES